MKKATTNLTILLQNLKPTLNPGEYVFCTISSVGKINMEEIIMIFKESESFTVVLLREAADKIGLGYDVVYSWITLTVHSSLEAIGLTAAFSNALSDQNISCNVVAGFYHDHIFVNIKDTAASIHALEKLSCESL